MKYTFFALLLAMNCAIGQNHLIWDNEFPQDKKAASNDFIRSTQAKLYYSEGLKVKSQAGSKDVGESTLRNLSDWRHYRLYNSDVVMEFTLEGADTSAGLGMEFGTYSAADSRVITYRFLVKGNGRFYTNADSGEYSTYKRKLAQFNSTQSAAKFHLDGKVNVLNVIRQNQLWTVKLNGQQAGTFADSHDYPFTPDDIKFLFSGKFTMTVKNLTEDYARSRTFVKKPEPVKEAPATTDVDQAWKELGRAAETYSKAHGTYQRKEYKEPPKLSVLKLAGFVGKRDTTGLFSYLREAGIKEFEKKTGVEVGYGKSTKTRKDTVIKYRSAAEIKISDGLYEALKINVFKNGNIEIHYPFHWFALDAARKEIVDAGYEIDFATTYIDKSRKIRVTIPKDDEFMYPFIRIFLEN